MGIFAWRRRVGRALKTRGEKVERNAGGERDRRGERNGGQRGGRGRNRRGERNDGGRTDECGRGCGGAEGEGHIGGGGAWRAALHLREISPISNKRGF